MSPGAFVNEGRIVLSLFSAGGWTAGGHYMGLAAARDGAFHAFWVDARGGTAQIFTSRVRVDTPGPAAAAAKGEGSDADRPAPPPAPPRKAPALGEPVSVVDKVELLFDPTRYDPEKGEFSVSIRLRNVSRMPIHAPIRLACVGFGTGEPEGEQEKEFWKDKITTIVNSPNGKTGEGAEFDFDGALAGEEELAPGAQTNPVVVRFRLADPFFARNTRWNVTGRVAGEP